MEQAAHILPTYEMEYSGLSEVQTTLHDLIVAVNEEVEPEEDGLVGEVVSDMLDAGQIKFLDPMGKLALICDTV